MAKGIVVSLKPRFTWVRNLLRRVVTPRRDIPALDLRPGESLLRQSHAIRVWGLFGYQGRADMTTERFIFQPQRFYTRPASADPLLGGSRIEIAFSEIRRVTVASWRQIRFRGLPGLRALQITDDQGRTYKFQIPLADEWCQEISTRLTD